MLQILFFALVIFVTSDASQKHSLKRLQRVEKFNVHKHFKDDKDKEFDTCTDRINDKKELQKESLMSAIVAKNCEQLASLISALDSKKLINQELLTAGIKTNSALMVLTLCQARKRYHFNDDFKDAVLSHLKNSGNVKILHLLFFHKVLKPQDISKEFLEDLVCHYKKQPRHGIIRAFNVMRKNKENYKQSVLFV